MIDQYDEDRDIELSKDQVLNFLNKQKDKDLQKHYNFTDKINCNLSSSSEVLEFINNNKPITMEIKNGEIYYSLSTGLDKDELFTVNTENSFSGSDEWLFNKIVDVELVYPNISESSVSSEMTAFYICLIIASVLNNEFESEFKDVVSTYDFKSWKQSAEFQFSFVELERDWVQMGSETVKMIASAAKYALTRNSKKKEIPSQIDLPKDVASEFEDLRRAVANIRYEYDNMKLSEEARSKMDRLQIKQTIKNRDKAIEAAITQNPEMHKIWRLLTLNSNVIDPATKRGFILSSRKHSLILFKELYGVEPDRMKEDDLIVLNKLQKKLNKEAIRAALNKLFQTEVEKYKEDSSKYVPPNFV